MPDCYDVSDSYVTYRLYMLVESTAVPSNTYSFDIRTVIGSHEDQTTPHTLDINADPPAKVLVYALGLGHKFLCQFGI